MKDSPRARLAEVGALAATHGEARLLAMARQKYCGGAVRATGPARRNLAPQPR